MRSPIAFLLATALLTAAPAAAQTFGAKGGLDLTTVADTSFGSNVAAAPGGTVGGFVGINLFKGLSVQGDVLFTEQRTTIADGIEDRLQYIEVPVVLRYRVWGRPDGMQAYATGGGVFRTLSSAREVIFGISDPIDKAIDSTDTGAVVGVQVQVRPRWIAEARYVHGLTDIYNRFGGGRVGRHRTLQFTVGYRIRK